MLGSTSIDNWLRFFCNCLCGSPRLLCSRNLWQPLCFESLTNRLNVFFMLLGRIFLQFLKALGTLIESCCRNAPKLGILKCLACTYLLRQIGSKSSTSLFYSPPCQVCRLASSKSCWVHHQVLGCT